MGRVCRSEGSWGCLGWRGGGGCWGCIPRCPCIRRQSVTSFLPPPPPLAGLLRESCSPPTRSFSSIASPHPHPGHLGELGAVGLPLLSHSPPTSLGACGGLATAHRRPLPGSSPTRTRVGILPPWRVPREQQGLVEGRDRASPADPGSHDPPGAAPHLPARSRTR